DHKKVIRDVAVLESQVRAVEEQHNVPVISDLCVRMRIVNWMLPWVVIEYARIRSFKFANLYRHTPVPYAARVHAKSASDLLFLIDSQPVLVAIDPHEFSVSQMLGSCELFCGPRIGVLKRTQRLMMRK